MKVLLFARARDLAGAAAIDVDLAAGATVADLRLAVAARHPQLAPLLARCAVAVDNEFAKDDMMVPPNAAVALLPPVSGG